MKFSYHNSFTGNSVLYYISHAQAKWILNEFFQLWDVLLFLVNFPVFTQLVDYGISGF